MKQLPEHGMCFVCGTENPNSIGVQWAVCDDKSIFGRATLNDKQQGPPNHVHGGASAAMLDEAMGAAVWQAGHMAMSVNLNINYRQPIPLDVPVQVTAIVASKNGRKIITRGEIQLPDNVVAVEASGIFVEVEDMFTKFADQFQAYQRQSGEGDA